MDHSHMDHSHMDHSAMGHGDMDHGDGAMCNMNMLFTWDTTNLCIVFRWWRIHSTASLLFSLAAIVVITIGYEALRALSRRYERLIDGIVRATPSDPAAETTPFFSTSVRDILEVRKRGHTIKAFMYTLQTFYAFMLMLVFMTYNGWVMIAVSVGTFLGYILFGHMASATKDNACH